MCFLFYCVSRRKVSIGLHGVYRRCGWNHSRGYRDDLFDEVYDMYYIAEILCLSVPFISNFLEKRESTWEVFKGTCFLHFGKKPSKFFEGSNLLIPMVNPHIDMKVYPILGRIVSHRYLVAGYLPVRITLPTVISILLGPTAPTSQILLDTFLDYTSTQERGLIEEAMSFGTTGKFSDCMQQKILNVLSRFGCCQVPRPGNLMSCIEDIAKDFYGLQILCIPA